MPKTLTSYISLDICSDGLQLFDIVVFFEMGGV